MPLSSPYGCCSPNGPPRRKDRHPKPTSGRTAASASPGGGGGGGGEAVVGTRGEWWEEMCRSPETMSTSNPNPNHSPIPNGGVEGERAARDVKRQVIVQDLTRRLSHGDLPARVQAARELRKLVRASSDARSMLAVAPILSPLVQMLSVREHEPREVALLALLNLAVRNERNKVTLLKYGIVPPLVELLKSEMSRLRELATAAILSLSASESNKPAIAASGVAPFLVQILVSGSMQAKVDAVTALYNLSTCQDGVNPCLFMGSVPHLLSLLRVCKKQSKFAEKATALLEILSGFEEGRRAISDLRGGILTLVETVEDGSKISMENAVGILLTLCRSSRNKFRQLILNEGAIPGLLLLGVHGTETAKTKAGELLKLLRDDSRSKRVTPQVLENIVFDIALMVDGPDKAAETADDMLKDMFKRSLEITADHLHVNRHDNLMQAP